MFERREECDTYLTHIREHRWRRKSLMKIEEIHWDLSAPAMSTDVSEICKSRAITIIILVVCHKSTSGANVLH